MTRWALLLEYDGTGLAGWQRQRGVETLQSILEAAAARLNNGAPVPSVAAGRTDAGVHAAGQVAVLALPDRHTADQVRAALNFHMRPHRLVVLRAAPAPEGWSPRFDAIQRRYAYVILNRRPRPTTSLNQVWHVEKPLNAVAMQEAARTLLGHHDFTSFRATSCQAKSPIRTLEQLDVVRSGDRITIHAAARSFLHHQVRNMVGTLKLVGEDRWPIPRVAEALAARHRTASGPTAPPEGLTLLQVHYQTDPFEPSPAGERGQGEGGGAAGTTEQAARSTA